MKIDSVLLTGAGIFSMFGASTNSLYSNITALAYNYNYPITPPSIPISIILCAFNEEEMIERTLRSILSQNIINKYPQFFELIVVDNESTDNTAEIAKQYCQVITAPRGKLNARHWGINYAVGDIIVAVDADVYYPPNYLNLMLRHYKNDNVVAVQGVSFDEGNALQKIGSIWIAAMTHKFGKRLHGASSSFLKQAYYQVGGFDLSINQFDVAEMLAEEEVSLYYKMKTIGEVFFDLKACCFHKNRGLHGSIARELRLTDRRALEIAGGQRF